MIIRSVGIQIQLRNLKTIKASKMIKISSAIFKTFFLSLCIVANTHFAFAQTASILPPGYTQYLDSNGKPLSAGKVYNYIPSTTTPKTTWQDAAETIPNTNPVILDAGGRAKILGDGSYRQIVKDRNNVTIWDAVTSSTGSGSSAPTATGDGDLVGTIKPWAGMTAPNQYAFAYGQEISRTTYATLYTTITSSQTVFCNSGSPTLNGLSDTTNFWVGMSVEVSCVAAGFSTIISKTSSTVTLAANANVTANVTAVFFPWGRGNGTDTFNLPDLRGVVPAGNNNMGGVASSNLTTTYFGSTDPNSAGALGGVQFKTLTGANIPSATVTNIATTAISVTSTRNVSNFDSSATGGGTQVTSTALSALTSTGTIAKNAISSLTDNGGIAVSSTIAAIGSGYTNGAQTITVSGGTCTTQPQFTVTVAGNVFTGTPALLTAGSCTVAPTNPAATTGGGGTGGTLNVVYSAQPFSLIPPTRTTNFIVKITPDTNSATASGVTSLGGMTGDIACGTGVTCTGNTISVNLLAVPQYQTVVGTGTSIAGISTGTAGQVLTSNGPSANPSYQTLPASSAQYDNIAALKAATAPSSTTTVYVTGYFTANDGGEGWFSYDTTSADADNGGTIIIPNSAPATGRWIRSYLSNNGKSINVKWFGAKGDGATNDTTVIAAAQAVAVAAKGALYFPGTSACYLGTITLPTSLGGLEIYGDGRGDGSANGNVGSVICNNTATATLTAVSAAGSLSNVYIHDLKIYNSSSGDAIKIDWANFITVKNMMLFSSSGYALRLSGVGNSSFSDVIAYGSALPALLIEDNASTSSGPLTFYGGQFSVLNGNAATAINITGSVLGVSFYGTQYSIYGPNMVAGVTIDGGGTYPELGSVGFYNVHGESNYNTGASTGVDFLIGNTNKVGSVNIVGGNAWGQGNGTTRVQNDFIKIVAATSVSVRDFTASNLGSAGGGYARSMIRMEATFPAAGDKYRFENNIADITGNMYSDASGVLSTSNSGDASYERMTINTLNLGSCATTTTIVHGGTNLSCSQLNYADIASGSIATAAQYLAGTSSKLVQSGTLYQAETTTTYGTTTTFDFSLFINTAVTLTGNITTQTLSNVTAGKAGTIAFIQDGTGSRTTVWNSIFKWAGGTTPTLSTTASAVDILSYSCRSATFCVASLIKDVR